MSTYRKIHGRSIQAVTTDPTGDITEGQVWYNTTSDTFKTVVANEAWASTSPVIQSRDAAGAAGIQTAAMIFGGRNETPTGGPAGGPNQQYNLTEEYNGTGFSAGGAMVQGRQGLGGTGTQTAGLGAGGYHPPAPGPKSLVEEYDGSSWSEVTNMPTATFAMGSAGTQTAALFSGGRTGSGWVSTTYEYDGTNWTTGGALGTARTLKSAMTGIQTAAVAFGGNLNPPGGRTNKVEEYNGSSWSEVTALPTDKQSSMASGIQTAALNFGGSTPGATGGVATTFKYDGTNFSATGNMGSIILDGGSLKTASDNSTGLQMSGYGASTYTGISQEFTSSINVITAGAWASGGNMGTTRRGMGGAGTQTATAVFGGYNGSNTVTTGEDYDGSSWSSGAALNTPMFINSGAGTQTAALSANGYALPPGPYGGDGTAYAAESDGSSWTAITNVPVKGYNRNAFGVQTAAAVFGGSGSPSNPGTLSSSQEWDGSNWTSGGTMNTGRSVLGSGGTLTAGVAFGGNVPPATGATEEYNGSSWTAGGTMNIAKEGLPGNNGVQTAALATGGNNTAYLNSVEEYNGTSWSTRPSISTARYGTSTGDASSGLLCGSYTGTANTNITEEFTAESSALNVKTLTQS